MVHQASTQTLKEPEAARYVAMSRAYLRICRAQGRGPSYSRVGRAILYRIRDLDAWLDQCRVETREPGR
jgi:hypothetical protein